MCGVKLHQLYTQKTSILLSPPNDLPVTNVYQPRVKYYFEVERWHKPLSMQWPTTNTTGTIIPIPVCGSGKWVMNFNTSLELLVYPQWYKIFAYDIRNTSYWFWALGSNSLKQEEVENHENCSSIRLSKIVTANVIPRWLKYM